MIDVLNARRCGCVTATIRNACRSACRLAMARVPGASDPRNGFGLRSTCDHSPKLNRFRASWAAAGVGVAIPLSPTAESSSPTIRVIRPLRGKAGAICPVREQGVAAPHLWPRRDRFAAAMRTSGTPGVVEQLARGHPEGGAQPLDRVGANEAEAARRLGEPVDAVQAQAGELGQGVRRQTALVEEVPHA